MVKSDTTSKTISSKSVNYESGFITLLSSKERMQLFVQYFSQTKPILGLIFKIVEVNLFSI
jgi:hypothetical protein